MINSKSLELDKDSIRELMRAVLKFLNGASDTLCREELYMAYISQGIYVRLMTKEASLLMSGRNKIKMKLEPVQVLVLVDLLARHSPQIELSPLLIELGKKVPTKMWAHRN